MSDDGKDHEEPNNKDKEMVKEIEEKLWHAFNAFDKDGFGYISSSEVKFVLEMVDIKLTDAEMFKMISEIDPENSGQIPFSSFKPIIVERELSRIKGSDEEELLDAFVAMGGDQDGEGCVNAEKLISTIKNEFQMTIDIEGLIREIDEDESGKIEFDEFKALLC